MNTSREISTISYCSKDFLLDRLQQLVNNHQIQDYMMIYHDPEEDELKGHWHLWLFPNKRIDTMNIQEFLTEFNPKDPSKPFKCIPFRYSSVDDWIPYSLHDKAYLAIKGESRIYHYRKDDMIVYDPDSYNDNYRHAFYASKWSEKLQMLDKLRDREAKPADLIYNGTVPLALASSLYALKNLEKFGTYRNGRKGHE